jgi:hypothetical protein
MTGGFSERFAFAAPENESRRNSLIVFRDASS